MYEQDTQENYQPVGGATVLVLGILGLFLCGILSPLAWIRGRRALVMINDGAGDPAERGLVVAGLALGVVGTFVLAFTLWSIYLRTQGQLTHMP